MFRPEKCRACQERVSAEERVIEEIVGETTDAGNWFSKTPVLCLPHLSAVLRKLPDPEAATHLVAFEAAILARLAENMERTR